MNIPITFYKETIDCIVVVSNLDKIYNFNKANICYECVFIATFWIIIVIVAIVFNFYYDSFLKSYDTSGRIIVIG